MNSWESNDVWRIEHPSNSHSKSEIAHSNHGSSYSSHGRNLNVSAQLSIEKLPPNTNVEEIRSIFGRYGRITRIVCDYRISEERLNCWLDYEDERCCENAINRENNRKMDRYTIVVQKGSFSGSGDSGGSRKNRNSWSSGKNDLDFGSQSHWSDSSRGRGSRGARNDRRTSRGGGRFQPYDKQNTSASNSGTDSGTNNWSSECANSTKSNQDDKYVPVDLWD